MAEFEPCMSANCSACAEVVRLRRHLADAEIAAAFDVLAPGDDDVTLGEIRARHAPPAPVAEPAETREALRRLIAGVLHTSLCGWNCEGHGVMQEAQDAKYLRAADAVLAATPAPAAPGVETARQHAEFWRESAHWWRERAIKADPVPAHRFPDSTAPAVPGDDAPEPEDETPAVMRIIVDRLTTEVASLRRSLADAEARVAAVTETVRQIERNARQWIVGDEEEDEAFTALLHACSQIRAALAGAGTDEGAQG